MVESHPEGGARSLNLSLNLNDVLQGVRVALDLSKVPLIPPDPSTLPVGGWLGHFHLNWKFLGALPSVLKTLEFGLHLPVSSVSIPLSRVPLINSHYSSQEKNAVLCQAVSDMLLKGAIQEVKDPSSLAFYTNLFLLAKKTGGWRPVIDLSFFFWISPLSRWKLLRPSETPSKLDSGLLLWTSKMPTSMFPWHLLFTNCSDFKSWASCISLWQCHSA